MIVVGDFAKSVKITGYPEQIAIELEDAARAVRKALCEGFGETAGNGFFEFIIANARKEESERNAEADEIYSRMETEEPERIRSFEASRLMRDLAASFSE